MKTLFDGIGEVNKTEAVNELAELESFTISTYMKVVLHNLRRTVIKFFALFIPALREKSVKLKPDSMEQHYESKRIKYSTFSMNEMIEKFRALLKKEVRGIGFCFRNDDALLARVSYKASRILPKNQFLGKSIYEINDLLLQKYPHQKKPNYNNLLFVWLIGNSAIVLMLFFALLSQYISILPLIVIFFGLQSLLYYFISTRLSKWKLARFVWLAASGAGGFNESQGKLPLDLIDTETRENLHLKVRTIHSMWEAVNNSITEKNDLYKRVSMIENQIFCNKQIISGKDTLKGNSDSARIIEDKIIENKSLEKDMNALKQNISSKEIDLNKYMKLLNTLEMDVSNAILGLWRGTFKKVIFTQDFVFSLIRKFSLEDFSFVEKRLFETCNTASPQFLAKRISGGYAISFITVNQDIGNLMFHLDNLTTATFFQIDRGMTLQETPLSREELHKVIELMNKSRSAFNEDIVTEYKNQILELQEQRKTWEMERTALKDESKSLENQKENLLSDIKSNHDKIDDLLNQIGDKEKECEVLRRQLAEATTKPQVDALNNRISECEEELRKMENVYKQKMGEYDNLKKELKQVNNRKDEIKIKCEKQESEINERKRIITELRNDIEKINKEVKNKEIEIQQKDSDIYLKSKLLEKAETNKMTNQKMIQKLKKTIDLQKKEKKELEVEIQKKNDTSGTLEQELKVSEKTLESEKEEVVRLKNEIEKITAKLLTNQDIYNELYHQIRLAQEYVYIIAPFLLGNQSDKMLKIFQDAMRNNPDLKVKILYGMKARYGSHYKEDLNILKEENQFATRLEKTLGRNASTKQGNTHAKIMLFDDKRFILGSANVMSFGGNYSKQDQRDEAALFSTDKKLCLQLKKQYFDW